MTDVVRQRLPRPEDFETRVFMRRTEALDRRQKVVFGSIDQPALWWFEIVGKTYEETLREVENRLDPMLPDETEIEVVQVVVSNYAKVRNVTPPTPERVVSIVEG